YEGGSAPLPDLPPGERRRGRSPRQQWNSNGWEVVRGAEARNGGRAVFSRGLRAPVHAPNRPPASPPLRLVPGRTDGDPPRRGAPHSLEPRAAARGASGILARDRQRGVPGDRVG